MMCAAHKAAGGITSIYRQLGMACEELFRRILGDQYGLSAEQVRWSYTLPVASGGMRRLSLDGKLALDQVQALDRQDIFVSWVRRAAQTLGIDTQIANVLKGLVFEVRQGYKSKNSKRQNADIANAAAAYSQGFLPVALILSAQIDFDLIDRYRSQRWLILRGIGTGTSLESSYVFMCEVIGYDLETFFTRYAPLFKREIEDVLQALLSPDD